MALNHYFNNFPRGTTSEQLLIEDLLIEAIKEQQKEIELLKMDNARLKNEGDQKSEEINHHLASLQTQIDLLNTLYLQHTTK